MPPVPNVVVPQPVWSAPPGTVTLSSAGSIFTGTPTYTWAIIEKPDGASPTLTNGNSASPTLTGVTVRGTYIVFLRIDDATGSSHPVPYATQAIRAPYNFTNPVATAFGVVRVAEESGLVKPGRGQYNWLGDLWAVIDKVGEGGSFQYYDVASRELEANSIVPSTGTTLELTADTVIITGEASLQLKTEGSGGASLSADNDVDISAGNNVTISSDGNIFLEPLISTVTNKPIFAPGIPTSFTDFWAPDPVTTVTGPSSITIWSGTSSDPRYSKACEFNLYETGSCLRVEVYLAGAVSGSSVTPYAASLSFDVGGTTVNMAVGPITETTALSFKAELNIEVRATSLVIASFGTGFLGNGGELARPTASYDEVDRPLYGLPIKVNVGLSAVSGVATTAYFSRIIGSRHSPHDQGVL